MNKAEKREFRKAVKNVPWIVIVIAVMLLFVVIGGVIIPKLTDRDTDNRYFTTSDLKEAVQIENLSTVKYVYRGIAEHHNIVELPIANTIVHDEVDYRVKYEADIRAYFNLSDIEFKKNEETRTVIAYLPEAQIGEPSLASSELGFLPDDFKDAKIKDVIALCKEDAANDVNIEEIKTEAKSNLEGIIEALTKPILKDDHGSWEIEFDDLTNYAMEPGNETE